MQTTAENLPAASPSPFDSSVTRQDLHFRRIDMRGYKRSDGLFEIEGRVTDRKPYDFISRTREREVPANQPIHDMGVRVVIDEDLTVLDIQTFTDASPYPHCTLGGLALQSMKGVRMTNGWTRAVRSRLGGNRACTHLMELLLPMATTAYQALALHNRQRPEKRDATGRPTKIDSCYAYGASQDIIKQLWPEYYRPTRPAE
jgi:hypothetical protein